MRFRLAASVGLLAISASTVGAQGGGAAAHPSCTGVTADACQQTVDMFHYLAPQLGTAITGGNMTLAQGGSLGGRRLGLVPHFTVGVRANLVMGNVPELQTPVVGLPGDPPPAEREFTTSTAVIPFPAVDASIGIFKGVPLALSNVGGVDLLLSAAYVPEVNKGDVSVTPDTPLKFGYGVRVGLLQESLVVPGIGVSWMKRDLPTTTIVGNAGTGSTLTVQDLALKTTAWRITASKSLLLFGVALGAGQDTYDASTSIIAATPAGTSTPFNLSQKVTRTNYFGDVSMNLLLLKIVGTVGMVSGGEITTYNSFDTPADKSRLYGSVGVRLGF